MRKIWLELRWQIVIGLWLASIFGAGAFMLSDNVQPYEYDAEHSYIVPSTAHDGEQITVMWKLKKINRICPGSNHRVLFDPKTHVILASYDPTQAAVAESIKDGYLNRTFLLPREVLPRGQNIGYRATVCYICNPLQRIFPLCVTTPELFFRLE